MNPVRIIRATAVLNGLDEARKRMTPP